MFVFYLFHNLLFVQLLLLPGHMFGLVFLFVLISYFHFSLDNYFLIGHAIAMVL